MAIKHDEQGFLIGDPIDLNAALSVWKEIRDDVSTIKTAIAASGAGLTAASKSISQASAAAQSLFSKPPSEAASTPKGNAAGALLPKTIFSHTTPVEGGLTRKPSVAGKKSAVVNTNRDNKGRFSSRNAADPANKESNDRYVEKSSTDETGSSALKDAADKIINAVGSAGSGMEETDPTVKAFNEVAQPASRGYETIAALGEKQERGKERWFRKIFGELKLFRKEGSVFNKTANRSLKNIEENADTGPQPENGSSWLRRYILPAIAGLLGSILAGSSKGFIERFSDAHNRAMEAYVAGPIRDMAGKMSGLIDSVAVKIESAWNAFTGIVKNRLGIDIQSKVDAAKTKVSEGINAVKESRVGRAASSAIDSAKTMISGGAQSAKDWVLGQTSKLFESGKGGAGTVSSGKGDFGGASYGTYQLSSSRGRVQEFLKSTKYGEQFKGLKPGTPEFNAIWKEVARSDPEFGAAQHAFIKETHFDPQVEKLKKAGIDISGRGAAAQDAVWSTAVQFGGKSGLIECALKGKDHASMSDADFVSAIQDYKIANNETLFKRSSPDVRAGTASRAVEEKKRLVALATQQNISPMRAKEVQTASVPVPSAPLVLPPMKIPDAPNIESMIGSIGSSGGGKNTVVASAAPQDVGQDVRDRRIAHIVTGGLSN